MILELRVQGVSLCGWSGRQQCFGYANTAYLCVPRHVASLVIPHLVGSKGTMKGVATSYQVPGTGGSDAPVFALDY